MLHLDGTIDWMVAQRNALLAWTGDTLTVSPRVHTGLSVAHWGSSQLTGRGLVALSAPGHIYELRLSEEEEIVLHPSHVVAYAMGKATPRPFRLQSVHLQLPSVPVSITSRASSLMPDRAARFWNAMRDTSTFKALARALFGLRTAARRTIWGDRLFLQFQGPATILMSSRGVRMRDVLTNDDVNEIADSEAGAVPSAVKLATTPKAIEDKRPEQKVSIHIARVKGDGKVVLDETKDLDDFVRR